MQKHALTLLIPMVLSLIAGCGAKVVVDDPNQNGQGGGDADAGTATPPLECGEDPTEGKIVIACISIMQGDFCPPAQTTPSLIPTIAEAMGVCAETTPTSCCGKPAIRQVVCDLPPSGNECCYTAHYLENVVCPD